MNEIIGQNIHPQPISITFYPPLQQTSSYDPQQAVAVPRFFPSDSATAPKEFQDLGQFQYQYLAKHRETTHKGNVHCFSLTEVSENKRADTHAVRAHGFVLDYDNVARISLPQDVGFAFYTTVSHKELAPRYRLVFQFSQPLPLATPDEREIFKHIIRAFLRHHPELPDFDATYNQKPCLDPRCLIPTQGWALPHKVVPTVIEHFSYYSEGPHVNPSDYLNGHAAPPRSRTVSPDVLPPVTERERQAREALLRHMEFVRNDTGNSGSTQGSEGSNNLFVACCFGPDFDILMETWLHIIREVYAPVCVPPFTAKEIFVHVASAYTNSQTAKDNSFGNKCRLPEPTISEPEFEHPPAPAPFTPEDCVSSLPPGLAKDLCEIYLDKIASVTCPQMALACVLTILSITKGKKYYYPNASRLFGNLFTMVVDGPGTGKTTAFSKVQEITEFATSYDYIMPKVWSASGITTSLYHLPLHTGLFLEDEMGSNLASLSNVKNRSAQEASVLSTLNFAFSGVSNKTWKGTGYAQKPKENKHKNYTACRYPYLTILGATQDKNVFGLVSPEALATGFTSRWLLMRSDPLKSYPKDFHSVREHKLTSILPRHVREQLIYQGHYSDAEFPTHPDDDQFTRPISISDAGLNYLADLELHLKTISSPVDGAMNRTIEITKKLALLITDTAIVDSSHLQWAFSIVRASLSISENLIYRERIERPLHTNRERLYNKVMAILQRGSVLVKDTPIQPGICSLRAVHKMTNSSGRKEINDILDNMEASGIIKKSDFKPPVGSTITIITLVKK